MTTCQARSSADGQIRCAKCRVAWDRDDSMVCPAEVPPLVPATRAHDEDPKRSNRYVSALAPDRFSR